MRDLGFRIPRSYVCHGRAYQRYIDNDLSLVSELRNELGRKLNPDKSYAVRSSADIEDGADSSFAGQFKSALNVRGVVEVLQAIWSVWSSARSPAVQSYLVRQNLTARDLAMSVIVQEMVPARASGVALSKNPVTGADEVVVEAVPGLGDALVQKGVTPERWINKWGNWLAKPEVESIPFGWVQEVTEKTREVSRKLQSPVDVEWAHDGQTLYFLQVREITTLNRHQVYSNHISKEMLPGIIKPLIASVNLPMVSTIWVRFMNEMIGRTRARPEELAKPFYYRVYFNMGMLGQVFEDVGMPAESVELMMNLLPEGAVKPSLRPTARTLLRLPNMLRFAIEKWFFAGPMSRALPVLEKQLQTFDYRAAGALSEGQLLAETQRLYAVVQQVVYYNKVGQILMGVFNAGLKSQLKGAGVDFANLDLMDGYPGMEQFKPEKHLVELHREFETLDAQVQERIRHVSYEELAQIDGADGFRSRVAAFLDRFGHLSDNGNDFSAVPWRETPDVVLRLIIDFVGKRESGAGKVRLLDLKPNALTHMLYAHAREFSFLREKVSSIYTFGYGLFRYYYLAMGKILTQRGWLEDREDVFYLTDEEVKAALTSPRPLMDYRAVVRQHKANIERYRNIALPPVIYGDMAPPIQQVALERLCGIPASLGHYTGPVTLVQGIQDFPDVHQGDVLVIPYSDVGWTPLFARAGAVISESGGLLSHSSIVAREYGIPAVVSVAGAMSLRNRATVTVNGQTGEILIHAHGTA